MLYRILLTAPTSSSRGKTYAIKIKYDLYAFRVGSKLNPITPTNSGTLLQDVQDLQDNRRNSPFQMIHGDEINQIKDMRVRTILHYN
jgi:hypothetical protein